MQLMKWRNL